MPSPLPQVIIRHVIFAFLTSGLAALLPAQTAPTINIHDLAQRIDHHYNHLTTLRAAYTEHYQGMGQDRTEHGTLLLKKPGRMRWTYTDGKLFILDGKFATSYTPGDPQAQRLPAKQLDDLRSPLRFLLGHTEIEKELDHLVATSTPASLNNAAGITLTGTPRYILTPAASRKNQEKSDTSKNLGDRPADTSATNMPATSEEQRIASIAITANATTGIITALRLTEIDGATTDFQFQGSEENLPLADETFRFIPPPGVTIVNGLPPV